MPFTVKYVPSSDNMAVHFIYATSLPVEGSVIHKHILLSPDNTGLITLSYISSDPK